MTDANLAGSPVSMPEMIGQGLSGIPAIDAAAYLMPSLRPKSPNFSTGPTAKPPGWRFDAVSEKYIPGRSHRSALCKAQLKDVIDRSKSILGLPEGWICAIVPGSDTGAVELALWSFLSDERGVDVLSFDSFSKGWAKDILGPLGLENVHVLEADYGAIPDLSELNFDRDVVLTWNGTTAGTCLPDGGFIPAQRSGLVLCDATSAAFAIPLPFDKLDVVTWSWQKSLGGEAAHGMIALSPAAQERLRTDPPRRGLPKIFTLTKAGDVNAALFEGATINTPSMLAIADHLVGLDWAENIGGLAALHERTNQNYQAAADHVATSDLWAFLAAEPQVRSKTALCLNCVHPVFLAQDEPAQRKILKALEKRLSEIGVAHDIGSYRDAPPGLRLWGGPTVDANDLTALMPWLDWALIQELLQVETTHA